ncbi:hypothetical protein ACFVJM_30260 [Streptomyces virginiae]|uniref:hypothetical protein n=1 Tax=Streptomyces virginiae TaxID=1961 RepID=UPI00362A55CA
MFATPASPIEPTEESRKTRNGRALGPGDLLSFLRRAGLDPDDVRLDDTLLIEWRGGRPAVWTPDIDGA